MTDTVEDCLDRIEQASGEDDGNPTSVLHHLHRIDRVLGVLMRALTPRWFVDFCTHEPVDWTYCFDT